MPNENEEESTLVVTAISIGALIRVRQVHLWSLYPPSAAFTHLRNKDENEDVPSISYLLGTIYALQPRWSMFRRCSDAQANDQRKDVLHAPGLSIASVSICGNYLISLLTAVISDGSPTGIVDCNCYLMRGFTKLFGSSAYPQSNRQRRTRDGYRTPTFANFQA